MITESELRNSTNGIFWNTFKGEMEEMRSNVLENMAVAPNIEEVYRAQGRAQVLNSLIIWPETQLEGMKSDRERDERAASMMQKTSKED